LGAGAAGVAERWFTLIWFSLVSTVTRAVMHSTSNGSH
jgi:hypothetical protein